jgi:hypothetical protein
MQSYINLKHLFWYEPGIYFIMYSKYVGIITVHMNDI